MGTVNVAVKPPAKSVVIVDGFVATAVPSYDTVTSELGKKRVPVTVTVVPTGPLVGSSDIVESTDIDEARGIMLLLSDTAGIERITTRRIKRDSKTRLDLFMCQDSFWD